MADNKIYFDENGNAYTLPNSDTQSQPQEYQSYDDKVKAIQESVWKKYADEVNGKLPWEAEESDKTVNKIKRPFQASNYFFHKYIGEPIYKGVDVVANKVGNKIGDIVNKIRGNAASDRVKALMKQYDEMNGDEIDFGENEKKQGYQSLGDYFNAKDKYEQDYRTYLNALDDPNAWGYSAMMGDDYSFEEPKEPNQQFASLTGTGSYKNWKPESKVGKVAKGASGIAGDMLPEMLEGWGGEVAMGALAPMYKRIVSQREEVNRLREAAKAETNPARKAKLETTANKYERQYFRDKRDLEEATLNQRYAKKVVKPEEYNKAKATLSTEEFDTYTKDIGSGEYSNGSLRGRFAPTHKKLEDYENQSLAKMMRERAARGENPIPEYAVDDLGEYTGDYAKWFESGLEPAERKAIVRNIRKGEPKPLPNPAAQRANAVFENARNRHSQKLALQNELDNLAEGYRNAHYGVDEAGLARMGEDAKQMRALTDKINAIDANANLLTDAEVESIALKNLGKWDISQSAANSYKALDQSEKAFVLSKVQEAINNGLVGTELDLARWFANAVSQLYGM